MSSHGSPAEGMSCACCWDDITGENYVEYLPYPSSENNHHPTWLPSGFCQTCLQHLLKTQFSLWTESLAKSTCLAEQRRLLRRGPPVNVRDDKALPCPNNEEVHKLWYSSTGSEHSAKLEGSLEGAVSLFHSFHHMSLYLIHYLSMYGIYIGKRSFLARSNQIIFI